MSGVFSDGSELAGEEGTLRGRRLGAGGHLPEGELELSEAWKRKWEWTSRGQSSGRTRPATRGVGRNSTPASAPRRLPVSSLATEERRNPLS